MRIKVHVQGLKGSGAIKPGEEPSALFNGILEVDGSLIEEVSSIEVEFGGGSIMTVKPNLMPGLFEVVMHDNESWPELMNQVIEQKKAYSGSGRLLAASE